jgi:hypothetical protein
VNFPACCADRGRVAAYTIAILGTFLVGAGLVWILNSIIRPEPVNTARTEERRKAQRELQAAATDQLTSYAFLDAGKGLVRLPVDRAMSLAVQKWQDPAAARTELLARFNRFNPPPPPKQPEKPSEFE